LDYLKERANIEDEYRGLEGCGAFSLPEVQDHFLLFMIYVNMVASIVVNKNNPKWKEKLYNNSSLLQTVAKNSKEIFTHVINNEIAESGLTSWQCIKEHKLRVTWLSMRRWLQSEQKYCVLHALLINYAAPSIDLFDDVFINSIDNLHERLFQHFYK
jgi:hypothetical protein